jgi:hypothetical protein
VEPQISGLRLLVISGFVNIYSGRSAKKLVSDYATHQAQSARDVMLRMLRLSLCVYSQYRNGCWALGAALSIVGIGLGVYAESPSDAYYARLYAEECCSWVLLAGLLLALLGALTWGSRTTITNCLWGAAGTAFGGCFIARFGRINIHGATAGLLVVVLAAAVTTVGLATIAVARFLLGSIRRTLKSSSEKS